MAENKKYGRAWARQYHTYLSVRETLLTINSCRIPSRINLQPNFTRGTYYHDYMCVLSSSVDPVPVVIHHPIRETPGTNYVVTDCETEEDQIRKTKIASSRWSSKWSASVPGTRIRRPGNEKKRQCNKTNYGMKHTR